MSPDAPLSPVIALALAYIPQVARGDVALLMRLDARLGAVRRSTPAIAAIKYAWWREALERLDAAPPPPEPLLADIAAQLLKKCSGAELGEMAMGWSALIEPEDERVALAEHAVERGGRLFNIAAALIGEPAPPYVLRAGEGWALADIAPDHPPAREMAAVRLQDFGEERWPKPLRPLGMLAALAQRETGDISPGAFAQLMRMMRHRLIGR